MPAGRDPGPTVKDMDRYEALRSEGMSKEKAARIANSDRRKSARREGPSSSYEQWTKRELYDKAKEIGIDGRSTMSKSELVDALRYH